MKDIEKIQEKVFDILCSQNEVKIISNKFLAQHCIVTELIDIKSDRNFTFKISHNTRANEISLLISNNFSYIQNIYDSLRSSNYIDNLNYIEKELKIIANKWNFITDLTLNKSRSISFNAIKSFGSNSVQEEFIEPKETMLGTIRYNKNLKGLSKYYSEFYGTPKIEIIDENFNLESYYKVEVKLDDSYLILHDIQSKKENIEDYSKKELKKITTFFRKIMIETVAKFYNKELSDLYSYSDEDLIAMFSIISVSNY